MEVGINSIEFKQIFDEWYKPLKNFIYYKTGDIEVAEDVIQETFLKVWENRVKVKKETIKPYLYKIATNLFINSYEKQKLKFKFANQIKTKQITESPEFEMEMQEFDNLLQKTLAELDEKQRTVFLMNRIDKMTYSEIAESLDLSVKAIEKRMSIALEYLHNKIKVKF